MFNNTHVIESIPAYVLGALEEEETRQVTEHLAGCYVCRKELETYQTVSDEMLFLLPEVTPPPALRSRLLERVDERKPKQAPVPPPSGLPRRLLPIGTIAGLLLILLLAASNLMLWMRVKNMEYLTGPLGMRAIPLQNTDSSPGASGFVVVSADGKNGVLVVDKLQPLDPTQEYQVWLQRDSTEISAAVFSVDEDGYRGMRLIAPESLLTYSSVRVTVEPAGGSSQPTCQEVLNGSLFNAQVKK